MSGLVVVNSGVFTNVAGQCDFKLDKFLSASPEFFETYYGEDNDGDIMKPRNLQVC